MTIRMFRFWVYMGIRANDIIGVRLYMGKIKFNVAFCLSVKVILMILGIAGYISLWEAVLIGDMGITLLVVGNSLLLAK